MTGSIRRRVGLIVLASITPVLAGGAYLSYRRTAVAVRERFDRDLETTARVLADLAEYDEDGYELEIAPLTTRLLESEDPVVLEAWLPGGRRLYRSPSLGDADLPVPGPMVGSVGIADGELPGDIDARVATVRFVPRSDLDAGGAGLAQPMALSAARLTAGMEAMLGRLAILVRRHRRRAGAGVRLAGVARDRGRPAPADPRGRRDLVDRRRRAPSPPARRRRA